MVYIYIDLLNRQRRHSRQASAKFLQHLKEAIVAENESLEGSNSDMNDDENSGDIDNEQSSPPIEQTPDDNSDENSDDDDDSEQDNASVDSISNNKYDEIERRATIDERNGNENNNNNDTNKTSTTMNKERSESDSNPFADNFEEVAAKTVRRYSMQRSSQSGSNDNESSGVDILGVDPIQKFSNIHYK